MGSVDENYCIASYILFKRIPNIRKTEAYKEVLHHHNPV